jgi:hypothetical protein
MQLIRWRIGIKCENRTKYSVSYHPTDIRKELTKGIKEGITASIIREL